MNKILLAAAVLAVLASQLFPASAIQAAGPVASFDLPARAVQAYEQRLREQETPPAVYAGKAGRNACKGRAPCLRT